MKSSIYFSFALLAFSIQSIKAGFDHQLFDAFLKEHVKSGLVNYEAAGQDPRLQAYLDKLASADLEAITDKNERLAFFINAYNAYTIQLVVSAYPVNSIRLIKGLGKTVKSYSKAEPWKIRFSKVAGETYTLDEIEHEILRAEFKDPRIHFAIVCGAISCPILRSEAYIGSKIDEQLQSQGKWFFGWRNQFDIETKTARLSKILEWFQDDFGGDKKAILETAQMYVKPATAKALQESPNAWSVDYLAYDWSLNAQK